MALGIGLQGAGIGSQGIPDQTQQTQTIPEQGINDTTQTAIDAHNSGVSDDWKQYDLRQNPYLIGWGEFNIDPAVSTAGWWNKNLQSAYKDPKTQRQRVPMFNNGIGNVIGGFGGLGGYAGMGRTGGIGDWAASDWQDVATPYATPTARVNFKDANLAKAIDMLSARATDVLTNKNKPLEPDYPSWYGNQVMGGWNGIGTIHRRDPVREAEDARVAKVTYKGDTRGFTPWDKIGDNDTRTSIFNDVAKNTGMTYQDLLALSNKYSMVNKAIYEPVGASWQDLKQSPFYKDGLLSGIRSYSGYGDNFFKDLNAKAGGADNPYFLPAEYFALHGPKIVRKGLGGDGSLANRGYESVHAGFSDIAHHDPYRHQDWTDYITSGKEWWQLSPAEVAKAKSDMAHHVDLLDNSPEKGGPFDMARESGATPGQLRKRKPNSWKDSSTLNMSDISDNMMIHNKGALNDFTDAQRNAAIQSAIQIGKKKKKKKGGFLGGLGSFLGPLSTLASFVPGLNAISLPLKVLSAVNSFASGNPLGGVAGLIGASGLGNTLASGIGNSINGALSTTSALSGMGDTIGSAIVGGGLGALGAAGSGNAGTGALLGALGPITSGGLQQAGLSPQLSSLGSGALTSGLGYLKQQQLQKKTQQAAIAKMKAQRRV